MMGISSLQQIAICSSVQAMVSLFYIVSFMTLLNDARTSTAYQGLLDVRQASAWTLLVSRTPRRTAARTARCCWAPQVRSLQS